jgi:hypothetical protein
MKPEDVDFETALAGLPGPVFNDVEIAIMDVEVSPVEIKDCSAVHHLAPLEGTKYLTWPTEILERSRVDLSSVVDGEIPVAVWAEVSTSPGSAKVHCLGVGQLTTSGNDRLDELIIHHVHSVPDTRPYYVQITYNGWPPLLVERRIAARRGIQARAQPLWGAAVRAERRRGADHHYSTMVPYDRLVSRHC